MKTKGCLGCLGCGCLVVILSIVIPIAYGWYWANTEGKKLLSEGIQKVTEESVKYAFEPESAAEIASLTKEINNDIVSGKLGITESFTYMIESFQKNENLHGQIIFAVIYRNLKGKVSKNGESPLLIDDEAAEAVRTIMYAMKEGKTDVNTAMNNVSPLLEKNKSGDKNDIKVKKNITKEDMEKVAKALKEYVKMNNLQAPEKEITPDSLAKEQVINFLNGLRKLRK